MLVWCINSTLGEVLGKTSVKNVTTGPTRKFATKAINEVDNPSFGQPFSEE
jgi:hypothetical protein